MKPPFTHITKTGGEGEGKGKKMAGPNSQGPQKRIHCHQPFLVGEIWLRMTTPPDPKHGSYVVGIHERCRKLAG